MLYEHKKIAVTLSDECQLTLKYISSYIIILFCLRHKTIGLYICVLTNDNPLNGHSANIHDQAEKHQSPTRHCNPPIHESVCYNLASLSLDMRWLTSDKETESYSLPTLSNDRNVTDSKSSPALSV